MAMPATHMEWTVDMLDGLPDDGQRYEVVDGALFVTPAPSDVHRYVVGELYARLLGYLKRSGIGHPVMSPADVRRGDRRRNRIQPDIFVVRVTDTFLCRGLGLSYAAIVTASILPRFHS
jgi:hypothetical protein